MNVFEKYVTEYMISENDAYMSTISQQIIDNPVYIVVNEDDVQANLLKLIQTLGTYLTHQDKNIRFKAIGLLTYNIKHCQQEKLNESTVSVLVNFYCSRLSDHASVPNLILGLAALTEKYTHFSSNCTRTVVESLNHEIHVQSFPHLTRNAAFQIFENMLNHHLSDLQPNQFIPVFICSITGEKDPRNLMTIYSIIQLIIESLDITNHVEDLFYATSCYFPITFRPPPDNPYGITAKDLKLNLRKCMAATPLFSKFALPLLLQKLTTTSGTAKKDSLETLTACVQVYPTDELVVVGTELYDAIKAGILNEEIDPGLREPSLDAINALTKALSRNASSKNAEITRIIQLLIDDCANLLQDLDEASIKPASLILRSTASASPFVYSLVECTILPKLLRQYRDNGDVKDTYLILCTMVAIIQARKIVFGPIVDDQENSYFNHDSILVSYKTRFIEIFSSAIQNTKDHPEVRLMGILGLGLLCVLSNLMTKIERTNCVKSLSTVLETEEEESLRNSVEMSLLEISSFDPNIISNVTVPVLVNALPDFSSEDTKDGLVPYQITLSTIQKLCTPSTIYVNTEQQLLRKFIHICSHNEDKKYALEIITTLRKLLQFKNERNHSDVKSCVDTLLHPLLVLVTSATLDDTCDVKRVIILNPNIIQTINLIILTVFHNLDATEQLDFTSKITKYFESRDLVDLGLSATDNFHPLGANAPKEQVACVQMYAIVMSAFRKDAKMPGGSTQSFLDSILERALKSDNQEQVISFSRIISSLINKHKIDDLDRIISRLEDLVQAKSLSGLIVYIWVTKALVTSGHKKGLQMTDSIIQWIPDPVVGKQASIGFDVLSGDDPLCLNKLCFANISILYKQKFMTYSLPKLLKKISTCPTEDEKLNYLVAVAYLLKNVPKAILIEQIPPLVLLLIESMYFPEIILHLSTLDLFKYILNEANDIIQSHIGPLVPALVALISPKQTSMKVRIAALECLELVATKISREIVLPYANDTIKELAIPLDDRKRLVRKKAVECREKWYLLCQKQ